MYFAGGPALHLWRPPSAPIAKRPKAHRRDENAAADCSLPERRNLTERHAVLHDTEEHDSEDGPTYAALAA